MGEQRYPGKKRSASLSIIGAASLLVAFVVGSPPAEASPGETPQTVFHGVPHDMLFGLSMEGSKGVAVGDFGLVVETVDGGKSWTSQKPVAGAPGLFAVIRKNGRCIAAGQQGLILFSEDCRQWTASPGVTNARILSVDVNANGIAFAVGGFGTILRSADWGKSWKPVTPDWKTFFPDGAEPHLYDVHVTEDGKVTIIGEFEMVLRSPDGGEHWNLLHKGKRSLFALKVTKGGELYAAGQEGLILKSIDDGVKWRELPSGTKSILTGLWAGKDGFLVASGIYTILYSGDGGSSWQADQSRSARMGWHQAVAGTADGEGNSNVVLVGSGGSILTVRR